MAAGLPKILTTAQLSDEHTKGTAYLPGPFFLLLELNSERVALLPQAKVLLFGRYDGDTSTSADRYINVSEYGDKVRAISKRHILLDPRKKVFRVYDEAKTAVEYEDKYQNFVAESRMNYRFNDDGKFIIGNVRIIVRLVKDYVLNGKPYRLTQYQLPDKQSGTTQNMERRSTTPEEIQRDEKLGTLEQAIFEAIRPLLQNHSSQDISLALSRANHRLVSRYARNSEMDQACNEIIQDIRQNARVKQHPTKLEQMLEVFMNANGEEVTLDSLTPLYRGIYNERQAVSNAIVKLNDKLADYNLQIVPAHYYHVVSTKSNE